MSLYLKYRPRAFLDVVGQDHIISTLTQAVSQDQISHAYLFSGPRGTGKTSVARILANTILTKEISDKKLKEQVLKEAEESSLVDLIEIDAASNRGIDDIRGLVEKIQFSPVVASAKVYIIDEVHMLTKEAFNALLKTLEEPPEYAFFILATTELQKIPLTIQSRCQRFSFRQIQEEEITRHLQFIADKEHVTIDRPSVRAIAHHVQGGMRDAIAFLDQLRSLKKITLDDVKKRVGETGQEYIEELFAVIEQRDTDGVIGIVKKMEDMAVPLDNFVRQLLSTLREQLHENIKNKKETAHLTHMLDVLLDTIQAIRIAPIPGLVLEAALLSFCGEGAMAKIDTKKSESVVAAPVKEVKKIDSKKEEKAKEIVESTAPKKPAQAPKVSLETVKSVWSEVIGAVSIPSVKMSLKNGLVEDVSDSKVVVSFPSAFHRDKVAGLDASRCIEKILEDTFQVPLKIECVLETEREAVPQANVVNLADAAQEIF
jgi:DNA polymerase III subunit gamma/tau